MRIMKMCEGKPPQYEDLGDFLDKNGMGADGMRTELFKEIL